MGPASSKNGRTPGRYRTASQSDYARALYVGTGSSPGDALTRPKVGIISSADDSTPGHVHLGQVSGVVKQSVYEAGGIAYVAHIPAGCDGIAQGPGMHWSLLSRDFGAGAVEAKVQMHQFDAMVCICSCDKAIPAMLMACARIDIPTITAARWSTVAVGPSPAAPCVRWWTGPGLPTGT